VLGIIGIANLPLVLLALLSIWRLAAEAQEQMVDEQTAVARVAAAAAGSFVDASVSTVRSVAVAPELMNRSGSSEADLFLQRLLHENPNWEFCGLFASDGSAVAGAGIAPDPTNVADHGYFQQALSTGRTTISGAFVSRLRNVPIVVVAEPVDFTDGGRGVLAIGLSSTRLAANLKQLVDGPATWVAVVDAQGQAFVHPDPAITASLTSMRGRPGVEAALAGNSGSQFVDESGLIVAYSPVESAGWAVLIAKPAGTALDLMRRQVTIGLGLFALAAALALLIGWYLGGRLSRSYQREREARAQAESAAIALQRVTLESERGRRFLEQLIETAPIAIAILKGPTHEYVARNARYQNLFPVAVDQEGTLAAVDGLVNPDTVLRAADEVYATGAPAMLTDCELRPSSEATIQEPRYITIALARYGDAEGVLLVAVETTDEVLLRHRSEREKDEFLSTAAHELKTPLAALLLATQMVERMLARGPIDPARLERTVANISTQVGRASRLIADLLDVSRIRAGSLQLRIDVVDLLDLVNAAVEQQRDALPEGSGHQITFVRPEDGAPIVVPGDESRLDQVFTNLLSNAVKYSPRGGLIEVRVTRRGSDVVVAVADHGMGIPESDRESVFAPFGRTAEAQQSGVEGTGLGLYITRRIVEAHGGTIAVTDTPGGGATFVVSLSTTGEALVSEEELARTA
jgi:signal transduction histidine kinase